MTTIADRLRECAGLYDELRVKINTRQRAELYREMRKTLHMVMTDLRQELTEYMLSEPVRAALRDNNQPTWYQLEPDPNALRYWVSLGMGRSVARALAKLDVGDADELAEYSASGVLRTPYLGWHTLRVINEVLEKHGLALRGIRQACLPIRAGLQRTPAAQRDHFEACG